jgi:FtsH-binding integral membrane protein
MDFNRGRTIDVTARGGIAAQGFIQRVYVWMTLGLAVTGVASFLVASSPEVLNALFGHGVGPMIVLILVEFGIVFFLSARVMTLNPSTASALFFIYSALNGVTLTPLLLAYTGESVTTTFFVTAGLFGAMSVYGSVTKRDLTDFGSFLHMGVAGLVIAMVVNMFLRNSTASYVISGMCVIIFTGLAAYDSHVLRRMAAEGRTSDNIAVLGALKLYMDFINIFIHMLMLFGKRR